MNIIISNAAQEPIYEQIMSQIKGLIMKGDLTPEQALPSIRNLAKELQISVITTKRAYDELEKEGYIVTVPGKGSFIASKNKELFREARIKIVEEKIAEAVSTAKYVGITLEELKEMLTLLYEEDE
ncbi:GntR family transcriptional regulator [Bacillus massilinigeriensis]|uniref:GntR family transcriptional regulator n=1 Tax=Bacillus massilionigeriensis TaxID=1805475 RepID=UPI00096B3618|nr:GntR family transcriptional regulator [Bacillus massilionigeriensis]